MITRSVVTFFLYFTGLAAVSVRFRRRLTACEAYLAASGYAFFFVLSPTLPPT